MDFFQGRDFADDEDKTIVENNTAEMTGGKRVNIHIESNCSCALYTESVVTSYLIKKKIRKLIQLRLRTVDLGTMEQQVLTF